MHQQMQYLRNIDEERKQQAEEEKKNEEDKQADELPNVDDLH